MASDRELRAMMSTIEEAADAVALARALEAAADTFATGWMREAAGVDQVIDRLNRIAFEKFPHVGEVS